MQKILFFFLLPLAIFAQAQPTVFVAHYINKDNLFPEEAQCVYLLANDVAFRKCPGTDCAVLAQLPVGTALVLTERSEDSLTLRGIKSNWYQATIGKQTGWIWGGMIAQYAFGSQTNTDIKFVAGYEQFVFDKEKSAWVQSLQIRAIKQNKEIDKLVVPCPTRNFGPVSNLGPSGLKNVNDLINLNVECTGGCGCLTGDIIYAWDGNKFQKMADCFGTPDAEFSSGVQLIFPSAMNGLPNVVIKDISSYNDTDELREKDKLERISTQEFYSWDGKQLVPNGKPSVTKKYLINVDFH